MNNNNNDLIIFIAYFSIPIQILFSLWKYPRLAVMPVSIFVLLVLFAFFIFLCGSGHFLKYMDKMNTHTFHVVNTLTAWVSLITALYSLPLVPSLLSKLDESLKKQAKLNEETKESKKKLLTFMAFLCHEIRNPLFAITSSATALQEDTVLTEEQIIAVGSIMDSAILMSRLVNDVLDISKIDAGKLQLEKITFDLHGMLHNLCQSAENQVRRAHGDKVNFQLVIDEIVPQIVCTDQVRLLQIIYNLLTNSIKFTEVGNISLRVSVYDEETNTTNDDDPFDQFISTNRTSTRRKSKASILRKKNNSNNIIDNEKQIDVSSVVTDESFSMALLDSAELGTVHSNNGYYVESKTDDTTFLLKISVTDTGIGIEDERLETIFEPYSQAKLSDYREHGGTGLGLSIISGLVTAMGGRISAKSTIGKGSDFVVIVPIQIGKPEEMENDHIHQISDENVVVNPHCKVSTNTILPQELHVNCGDTVDTADSCFVSLCDIDRHNDILTEFGSMTAIVPNNETNTSNICLSPIITSPQTCIKIKNISPTSTDLTSMTIPVPGSKSTVTKPIPPKKAGSINNMEPFTFRPNECVVLVVDDNQVNQKIISKMLGCFNLEYKVASNGQEAVDYMKASRNLNSHDESLPWFGLVFMDLQMPVKDGYQATAELRKDGIYIPIIVLTANALSQEKEKATAAGATEFITKPILRKDLYKVCKRHLG